MTFSPLISRTVPHHNKFGSRAGRPINRVIQHHHAASSNAGLNSLTAPAVQKSTTYVIMSDGEIIGQVPEEFRPWTSGSFEADASAITIEVQNVGGSVNGNDNHPAAWPISDAAYSSIIRLLADVAKRHGWGGIAKANYAGHREFGSTACPGGYLWARLDDIRQSANVILGQKIHFKTPPTKGKSVWQLADEVMDGLHGNGSERKASLGDQYAAVQREINRRSGKTKPTTVRPTKNPSKSIAKLADEVMAGMHGNGDARRVALGRKFKAVQREINRRAGIETAPSSKPARKPTKSINQLADEVLAGVHGNGDARRKALGRRFNAVQNEINRRLNGGRPNPGPNISQLADAVLRGQYGNGADRKRALGRNYQAVQAEINRRFRA